MFMDAGVQMDTVFGDGSKNQGGFFGKQVPDPGVDREAWMEAGRSAYRAFISGLPLWTTLTRPVLCGWALRSVGAPCVAQRV